MDDVEIKRVFFEGKEIVLVGTAHISSQSVEFVENVIEQENPDVVGVELDKDRLATLDSPNQWKEMNIIEAIKGGKTYLLLLNLLLSNVQRKLGKQVGVKPGAEMKKAVDIAREKSLPIALLDRNIKVTLKRALAKMSFVEKIKLFWAVVMAFFGFGEEEITKEKVEELKKKDLMNQLLQELGTQMPSVKKVLVDERDIFIANRILAVDCKKIVVVVGAGHLDGIEKFLDKKRDTYSLNVIPSKKSVLSYVKYLVPLIFVGIVVTGFASKGLDVTVNILVYWILINGVLSALGALFARAHWKSIIVAFLAAPLTSLHPALAAGWFAGLSEAKIFVPKIKDFESLSKLENYSDLNKNRVTHILLVTAFANMGSTLGTIIALPYVLTLLT